MRQVPNPSNKMRAKAWSLLISRSVHTRPHTCTYRNACSRLRVTYCVTGADVLPLVCSNFVVTLQIDIVLAAVIVLSLVGKDHQGVATHDEKVQVSTTSVLYPPFFACRGDQRK